MEKWGVQAILDSSVVGNEATVRSVLDTMWEELKEKIDVDETKLTMVVGDKNKPSTQIFV